MKKDEEQGHEGHSREWADRARVELNPEKDSRKMAAPNQSPTEENIKDAADAKENDAVY